MKNFILEEMDAVGADGVDFIPIWFENTFPPVIMSLTRDEVITIESYPKTNRLYWKMIDGVKRYIEPLPLGVKNTKIVNLSEEFKDLF